MDAAIGRKFRVKGRCDVAPLFDQDGVSSQGGERLHFWPRGVNDGSADEDRFEWWAFREIKLGDLAIDLAPVAVSFDGEIQNAERFLNGMRDIARQEDDTGAGGQHRLFAGKSGRAALSDFHRSAA